MTTWKAPLVVAAFAAASSYGFVATAQVKAAPAPVSPSPAEYKIPGLGNMPKLHKMRFNPVQLHRLGGILAGATRQEGDIDFYYEGKRIKRETIDTENIEGHYAYGRDGRFDRIEYTDGVTITAKYGNQNELVSLSSSSGRVIGFRYEERQDGSIVSVAPTENSLEFHSAIAILRMKRLPVWMASLQDKVVLDDEQAPATPAGTIIVRGSKDPSPSGIDLIPFGGPGPYHGAKRG